MQTYNTARTGNAPLQFTGELIAEDEGRFGDDARDHTRYHNVRVYRTQGGNHVVAVEYHSLYQGELSHYHADSAGGDPACVTYALLEYDPYDYLPPASKFGTAYEEAESRRIEDVMRRFRAQIASVLGKVGAFETVE